MPDIATTLRASRTAIRQAYVAIRAMPSRDPMRDAVLDRLDKLCCDLTRAIERAEPELALVTGVPA